MSIKNILKSIDNSSNKHIEVFDDSAVAFRLLKEIGADVNDYAKYFSKSRGFNVTLPRLGITTTFVDASNPDNFADAVKDNTRAFFVESLGNPKLDVLDIEAIAAHSKAAEVPFIVDNTVATPALLNPIKHGANIVIHSLTKYIGGQGTSLGGAIIDGGTFNWANGKFPEFTEPSAGYHGLLYHETLGAASFTFKLILEGLRDFGGALSPFNAFQIIQGLETLPIRIKQHSENALEIAKWLEAKDEVAWVNYPGLESSKYKALADKYLPNGQSGIVTFGHKGGFEAAKKIADNTKLFSLLANIGDTKSLIIHPASTTHQQLNEVEQESAGVSGDLIRLQVKHSLQHITIKDFVTQGGVLNAEIKLSYQVFGQPLGKAPIILVNHALTGNSDVAGDKGWWKELVGDDKVIDTKLYSVLAFNIPGNGFDGNNAKERVLPVLLGGLHALLIPAKRNIN